MDKDKTVKRKMRLWTNADVVFLVAIFYLLGVLTAIICYIFLFFHKDPLVIDEETKHSFLQRTIHSTDRSSNLFLPDKEKVRLTKENEYLLWETSTVIRSALYQFVKENGKMPVTLSSLTPKYLSGIPKEPMTLSNKVVGTVSGKGGWVYNPAPVFSTEEADLIKGIEAALLPNIEYKISNGFEPLKIIVSNSDHKLRVVSGNHIIRDYPVGLGVEGKIISGSFTVRDKIMNPNKHMYPLEKNPYGKRGLELSNPLYAIHGTYKTESIGENQSNGCIRMLNNDVIELYSMIPIHTKVEISNNGLNSIDENPSLHLGEQSDLLYDEEDNSEEEDVNTTFFWSG
ncbi:L,D-transpeptidase [Peribacillus alkalitolerans]|uniref:L,D-transpeptidase n=1 Tax=Peribacillus alkalitolerans TaxID=1550385 RepID=UPI0013D08752|nr:L,D-transpeptidase [Peribacillus alkalitolerans]